jgi:hypothetical protein
MPVIGLRADLLMCLWNQDPMGILSLVIFMKSAREAYEERYQATLASGIGSTSGLCRTQRTDR